MGCAPGPRCSKPHNTSLRLLNLSPRRLRRHPRLQEIRFDVRLMQRVPYEGVSRMREDLAARKLYHQLTGRAALTHRSFLCLAQKPA